MIMTKPIPSDDSGEYSIHVMDMPIAVKGLVVLGEDDFPCIYINARYNRETQIATCYHELEHISNDDFYNADDIRVVETRACRQSSAQEGTEKNANVP